MFPIVKIINDLEDNFDFDNFWTNRYRSDQKYGISAMNVYETDNNYNLRFDIPGFKKEDIKVELVDNSLKISGVRKLEVAKDTKVLYNEKSEYSFSRSYKLPDVVKGESPKAKYSDGVLEIELEKAKDSKPKLITIN